MIFLKFKSSWQQSHLQTNLTFSPASDDGIFFAWGVWILWDIVSLPYPAIWDSLRDKEIFQPVEHDSWSWFSHCPARSQPHVQGSSPHWRGTGGKQREMHSWSHPSTVLDPKHWGIIIITTIIFITYNLSVHVISCRRQQRARNLLTRGKNWLLLSENIILHPCLHHSVWEELILNCCQSRYKIQ